jgi:hypothetical protein
MNKDRELFDRTLGRYGRGSSKMMGDHFATPDAAQAKRIANIKQLPAMGDPDFAAKVIALVKGK